MKLYTVDRANSLTEGLVCELVCYQDIHPPCLSEHVDTMFPHGVSSHGEKYFLNSGSHMMNSGPMLELVFEYVRCSHFLSRPSRFECMFAVDSVTAAEHFRLKFGSTADPIYRVESTIHTKADMNLLFADTPLYTSYFANLYWAGDKHPQKTPFWEYLIKCPVRICERIV